MEKTYRVVSLAVSGRGNKIFRTGDTVTENNFPTGRLAELVKNGHVVEHGETEQVTPIIPNPNEGQPTQEQTVNESDNVSHGTSEGQTEGTQPPTPPVLNPDDENNLGQTPDVPSPDADENEETDNESGDDDLKMDSVKVKQIKKDLKARGIKFDPNATKAELFKLWSESGQS